MAHFHKGCMCVVLLTDCISGVVNSGAPPEVPYISLLFFKLKVFLPELSVSAFDHILVILQLTFFFLFSNDGLNSPS